jgi:hypothetical protein
MNTQAAALVLQSYDTEGVFPWNLACSVAAEMLHQAKEVRKLSRAAASATNASRISTSSEE